MDEGLYIEINKYDLIAKIREHRARFKKSYGAMMAAYRKKASEYQKEYAKFVEDQMAGKTVNNPPVPPLQPVNRVNDYDFYVKMLETHAGIFVTLNETPYRWLWLDDWHWMSFHLSSLSAWAAEDATVANMLEEYQGQGVGLDG